MGAFVSDSAFLEKLRERDIPHDYQTRERLEEDARAMAQLAPKEFAQTVYLYYIARYLVVVYEVSYGQIPIQVWNEHRNAFDHYIRHIAKLSTDATDHCRKIEGHIQRAVLDISKIYCHDTEDMLNSSVAVLHKPSLALVDNGTFLDTVQSAFDLAKDAFIKAKTLDIALGDDARHNSAIISKYLDAVYHYIGIQALLRSSRERISAARVRYDAIHRESAAEHVKLSLLAKAIWYVLVFVLGAAATATYNFLSK